MWVQIITDFYNTYSQAETVYQISQGVNFVSIRHRKTLKKVING